MSKIGYYKTSFENPLSGNTMYTVKLVPYGVIDSQEAIMLASKDANIRPQDMAMGFAALSQAIEDFVLQGHSVTLPGLGNFRLTSKSGVWDAKKKKWKSGGADSMDKVTPDNIRGVYVRFRPSTELRTELANARFYNVTKTKFGGTKGGYDYTTV